MTTKLPGMPARAGLPKSNFGTPRTRNKYPMPDSEEAQAVQLPKPPKAKALKITPASAARIRLKAGKMLGGM